MNATTIVLVEYGELVGERPRIAGSNARLGIHGRGVIAPLPRLSCADGSWGFGACFASHDQIVTLLGRTLDEVFDVDTGVCAPWLPMEYALWDLRARRAGRPVYALLAALTGQIAPAPIRVPCYDTSLYMDDLHLPSHEAAGALIAEEASAGKASGHNAFKLKVGRGERHMPLKAGTHRDIAVIRAVRAALGPDVTLLLDANDGYNLNLAKTVVDAVADCRVTWLEEPFREDPVLLEDLHTWMTQHGFHVLIADGEGNAAPELLAWAAAGLLDVVQYDLYAWGIARWLAAGRRLEGRATRTAPHHYGSAFGNYAACHLAASLPNFAYVEWDEARVPGLDASGYEIAQGLVVSAQ
jgi:L-rhamnonate dehydratase